DRDPQAPLDTTARLRPGGTRRRFALVGGPERAAHHEWREAPRGPDRGSPPRVRVVPGHDPRRSLRRGRAPDLRRRLVRAYRVDRHEGLVPAPRASLSGARVPLREDPHRLARVPRLEPDGATDRIAPPVHA